jgi:YD repeat-containing protein
MTFYDGSTRTNQYDGADDVITFTDENGNQFSNTFDALGRKTGVAITPFAVVIGATTSQSFRYDGLSRMTFARNTAYGGMNADVTLAYDSLGRVLEDAQAYGGLTPRYVTNSAFTSYPVSGFTFPTVRVITSSYDLLYRRTLAHDTTGSGYDIATWNFFGPSRVAQVSLGNGVTCTWMNNAGTNSAVQGGVPGVPNPTWTSGDFLGYDGAARMIAKRFLAPHSGLLVVGFSSEYDRSGNKFFERALHAEDRSHLYEPFDPVSNLPTGGYDSLDRLRQYQRGTLASTGGLNNAGGGSITSGGSITVLHTDTQRTYLLDGLGNWRNTGFTPAGGSPETEVRQHNGLNQITRTQNGSTQTNPAYDKNGNLPAHGAGASYTWDALNRLVDVGTIQYAYLCLCQLAVADFSALSITRPAKLTQPLRWAVASRSFRYRRSQGTSRCSFAHRSMAA